MYEKFSNLTDDRIVSSLVGMTKSKFDALVAPFEKAYHAIQQERAERGEIKQVKPGRMTGNLDTCEKKLFFVLYYLKTYPTFDVLGFHFGFSGGHAHAHVDRLLPVLRRCLSDLGAMPERAVAEPPKLHDLIDQYKNIAIDCLECPCVRPQDEALQEARYSGKKKDTR